VTDGPRIAPLEQMPPDVRALVQRNNPRGMVTHLTRTMARVPAVARHFSELGVVLGRGLLPGRQREIVILRMGWRCGAAYEFGQHTLRGRQVGLSDDEITALTLAPGEGAWDDTDAALIAYVDELYDGNAVSDATWARLAARWSPAELVELSVLAGFYWMVSGFLNTMRVEIEEGDPTWPPGRKPHRGY
jgi:alkylhydroperoxidase family enzyme